MIVGIGTDIVDCGRIKKAYKKYGEIFLNQMLTHKEIVQIPKQNDKIDLWLASCWAIKEATVKALGTGFSDGITPLSIEIIAMKSFPLQLILHDNALKKSKDLYVESQHVSYSYNEKFAIAYVILEKNYNYKPQ